MISERDVTMFRVRPAQSVRNQFADIVLPQNPGMGPNDFSSPHCDSYCSESVSGTGPTSPNLRRIIQRNPHGFTPCMVCNAQDQMIGVSLNYKTSAYTLVVFNRDCQIIATAPAGTKSTNTFGGGYFYLDDQQRTILVQDNRIVAYDTANVPDNPSAPATLEPLWQSDDIAAVVTGGDLSGLYSVLPVWDSDVPNTFWGILAGSYSADGGLQASAQMVVVRVSPGTDGSAATEIVSTLDLPRQWNNNTFAVDRSGAYMVTNGLDDDGAPTSGYLHAFTLDEAGQIQTRWRQAYQNCGYLKEGMKNIGSGTTPTLMDVDGRELVVIGDNASPRMNVVICDRATGELLSETPVFSDMRSCDEASFIGVGGVVVAENNFGHTVSVPFSQKVANEPGMSLIDVSSSGASADRPRWTDDRTCFFAMNMLCRGSGVIFAHTGDWSDDCSATEGGMYAVSALDAHDGRTIWRVPLGRGGDYCHEYGGLYFNSRGDLFIGTNRYLISIQSA